MGNAPIDVPCIDPMAAWIFRVVHGVCVCFGGAIMNRMFIGFAATVAVAPIEDGSVAY
jgi:hypothetical protein